MGRVVALLNQKGGVGKTTVTLGLASAAAAAGHHVLVVDLDPQASSTWALGFDPAAIDVSTAEVLAKADPNSAILESTWSRLIHVMPASNRLQPHEHGKAKRLRNALSQVGERYDAVLIDCPPSLGNLTTGALTAADHALIVVEPSALGLRGIAAVAGEADRRYDELVRIVGKKAVWQPVIPQRVVVTQAVGERRPIHSYGSRAIDVSAAFDQLWKKLRRLTRD
jgi:cellulose biosynthesis protein BcsQ